MRPAGDCAQRGVYYHPVKPTDTARKRTEELMARIDFWHTTMPFIGTQKMVVQLSGDGITVGRKLVRRPWAEMGIHALYPKANLSKRNIKESIVPYLLRNKFVFLPNQVWSIDITYIRMRHGHMYLAAIIDWYSQLIVGGNPSDTLDTASVKQAVINAVADHSYPAILNSDQGCQFTSAEYKALLKELHIAQSMDGKSRWGDNIMIERWFRSLKTEEIYLNEYPSLRTLRTVICRYVCLHNSVRPHEALGN